MSAAGQVGSDRRGGGVGPRVSICVPTFNSSAHVGPALESALAQTYRSFELIVVDNASTDDTVDIVRSYEDGRIRIERNDRNLGPIPNFNRCLRLARGELVKFLHADDLLYPDCLRTMVDLCLTSDRVGLVFAPRDVVLDDPGNPEARAWLERCGTMHDRFEGLSTVNDGRSLFGQLLRNDFQENWIGEPSSVLFRRECLHRTGLFNTRLHQISDLELWLRIIYLYDVAFCERPLSVYRHHAESSTNLNRLSRRDRLDRLWLLEGLLSLDEFAGERARLERMRRQELRRIRSRALPSLVGPERRGLRLAGRAEGRRLDDDRIRGLLGYLRYRTLVRLGRRPAIHR